MKKLLLLAFSIFTISGLFADTHYWVGGTGYWNSSSSWSLSSGGAPGASIPGPMDDVVFDAQSFNADRQTVMFTQNAVCRNIDFSQITRPVVLSCAADKKLTVYGSYTLSPHIWNGFKGKTEFVGSSACLLNTAGVNILGDLVFNGTGSWKLSEDLFSDSLATISLLKGQLDFNGKAVSCGSFSSNSAAARTLNISGSEIHVAKFWNTASSSGLNLQANSSSIIFRNALSSANFQSGGLTYGTVAAMAAACTPSGTPCANFTISLSGTNVNCNGNSNGTATAVVTGGSGSFTYDWSPGSPTGDGTPTISGLGAGTFTVRVTDNASGLFCFCSIQITEPGVLFDFELFTIQPLCNGQCNGSSAVDATGGTPPYTYLWSAPSGTANDTATGLCAATYTVFVTDVNGCTGNTTVVVPEPAVLQAPGVADMVSCFGFCDGSATVNVTGGTAPYNFNWTPGNPTGDGTGAITNLCPGSFTLTVTDANLCQTTFDTVITQPPVLTLAVTKTDASCGGICDGTATATVTGGTAPYTYIWSNGSSTTTGTTINSITGLCAGSYTIQVTDANGCNRTDSVTITEPPVLVATANGTNVTCFGTCNGTATVIVTGGSGGNIFNWSPGTPTGDGTATITNLCPDVYQVQVTDINGCTDTSQVTITEPPLLVSSAASTNVLCFGVCNGTATATPTGGVAPYAYNWIPGNPAGDGTPNITGLCPGTYSVIVTDANGCVDTSASIIITQPPLLVTNATFTNVTCNGACNGTATAAPSGGTPGYTFLWSTGATGPTVSGLCPGSYTLTVTDANGCTASTTITIIQPNALNVSINSTNLLCNGICNATAAATVSGGTAGYTFDWLPGTPTGDGTPNINGLCAGSYTVNIVDANGCPASATTNVSQPTALSLLTAGSDASCFGVCDGSAAAIAGGGTPSYSYLWSPIGATTSVVSAQCAGTYTVTLTDANGCTRTDTVTIGQPSQLLGNPTVVSNVLCAGQCNGSATALPTGGTAPYSYNWGPGTPAGDNTPTITGLCAGTYSLVVTDSNSCSSTQSVTITQPPILSAPISGSTSSCNICNGTATVSPAGGTPPYTYLWNTGQTTPIATGLCPNVSYTVTVTDANGCVASNTVTIMQTIIITITTSNTTLSCAGACDGIATANAAGGALPYSFLWVSSGGIVSTNQTATGLCAGTYTVTVSDANGCFNTDTVTFTNPPPLVLSATSTNVSCGGACDGTATATVTGGTGAYTYLWMPGGQSTPTATALCAGMYTVTVTDANGCTDTAQENVTEPPPVIDNVTVTAANCTFADGSISVAPTGGTGVYSFDWGPGTPSGDFTSTITNLFPGTYTLNISSGGCVFSFNYLLNNINGPTLITSGTDATCNNVCNGSASTIASGGAPGYTYNWLPGAPAGDGSPAVTSLCGDITYTVQVTDAAGCIAFDTITIINPEVIDVTPVIVNESCGGTCDGSIALNASGGTGSYTYLWSTGATSSTISGLCAGAYSYTVTDVNGCDTTGTITITSPPTLSVSLTATNVLCASACNGTATATPAGGTPGFTYSWSHGSAFILPNVVNLCPGTYTVTVTDANSCSATDTITISEPPPLTSFTSQINTSCFGVCDGVGIVTAMGGTLPYSYLWNPGSIANDTATGLCAGPYNAIVTDANGCISNPPAITIASPAPILPTVTSTNPLCANACSGTATANPAGGTSPYSYLWTGGMTTQTVTGLCAGNYTVTVTDSSGCSGAQSFTLTDPLPLSANPTSTSPTCTGACNGTVTASPVGGTGSYSYVWTPGGSTSSTVTSLCAGVYTIIVTDANSCRDTQSVAVTNPLPINIIVGSTPANCGACDGTITVTPITGTAPYTYLWTPALPATPNQSGLCAGLYTVLVTDANGCDSTFVIPISNSGGATGEVVSTTDASCNALCNGAGSIDAVIGGTPPFSYLWNDPAATANDSASNLCAGNYFVQVTDANGCIHFSPVTINEPLPVISNATITAALCSTVCTGEITVNPSGGTPGYTYFWSPGAITGQGTPTATALCSGTYSVTITDANSCVQVDSFVVNESTPLNATISSNNIFCSSSCSGVAYVTITSGTAPFTIQWDDPSGQTNDTVTALCAGTYSAVITDANGCSTILTTTITATPAVNANAVITEATCGSCDGQVTVAPTGGTPGFSYLWSTGATSASVSGLCAGLYTVNIIDSAGCVTNASIPVSNVAGPSSASISFTNVTCSGACDGAVSTITPSGGTAPYTYLWIAGGQTTQSISGLCAGTWYVQITDANGCSLLDSVVISQPPPLTANQVITASTCGVCDGAITITPSGGAAPYTILWNTGSTASVLNSLCAGVYSVTITDAGGCSETIFIPLSNINAPALAMSSSNVSCNGLCDGVATVNASGGSAPYSYLWNDIGAQTAPSATGLCAGTYFVEVTGTDGCTSVSSTTIAEPSPIGFSLASTQDPLCNGNANGTITVIPSGGTLAYSYAWSPAPAFPQTTPTVTGLDANTYVVTVTDANGCSATQSVTLTNPVSLAISSVSTNSSCNTIPDASIDVTVGGGTLPYSYQWSGCSTATTEDLTGILSCSDYVITVSDSNNCVISDTITVLANQTVTVTAGNDTTFCENGSVTLTAVSSGPTTYQWFELPANTLTGSSASLTLTPSTGTTSYYVVADNGTGCSASDTISLTSNPLPDASAGPDETIVIGASVEIGGTPTTGTSGATISWNPAANLTNSSAANPVASPVSTTIYTVTITSAQGCVSTDSMIVTVLPTIVIPDGISPNGDGANDEWVIDGIELFPNCNVEVYNRWGEMLFQSPGYKEKWNGTYDGKELPVGTYYYIIDLGDPLFPDAYTGPITILR